jgi:hypothetical protein
MYGVRYARNVRCTSKEVKDIRKDSSQPHPADRDRVRRPRGSLTPEVILEAAEEVAGHGFDALTMRAVAARLSAVPMALYNHFATKEQLVDALLDRVLSRFEPSPPQTTGPRTCAASPAPTAACSSHIPGPSRRCSPSPIPGGHSP